jgi:hypothetical protein
LRAYKFGLEFNSEKVLDWVVSAPKLYDNWWRNLLQEAPQHILIETGLIFFIIWLVFVRRTVDPGKIAKNNKLSKKEVDWLLESWSPEPLVQTGDNVQIVDMLVSLLFVIFIVTILIVFFR